MKMTESLRWTGLYWLMYLPTTLILRSITHEGSVTGIFIIGFVLTLLLSVFLAAWNNEKTVEVYTHGEKQRQEPRAENSTRPEVGFEPGIPMRTDVNLSSLDADDDADISSSAGNAAE